MPFSSQCHWSKAKFIYRCNEYIFEYNYYKHGWVAQQKEKQMQNLKTVEQRESD